MGAAPSAGAPHGKHGTPKVVQHIDELEPSDVTCWFDGKHAFCAQVRLRSKIGWRVTYWRQIAVAFQEHCTASTESASKVFTGLYLLRDLLMAIMPLDSPSHRQPHCNEQIATEINPVDTLQAEQCLEALVCASRTIFGMLQHFENLPQIRDTRPYLTSKSNSSAKCTYRSTSDTHTTPSHCRPRFSLKQACFTTKSTLSVISSVFNQPTNRLSKTG